MKTGLLKNETKEIGKDVPQQRAPIWAKREGKTVDNFAVFNFEFQD